MKSNIALLLAPGFEEAEAIITLDILSRLGVHVTTVACDQQRTVVSYHALPVTADFLLSECAEKNFDAVVIPGGPEGTNNLAKNTQAIAFIRRHDLAGKLICPICSAAAKVLAPHGLLRGRRYVCSGTFYETITDGVYVDLPVVKDGNLLSGQGVGAAFDFAFSLAYLLTGNDVNVTEQAEHINYKIVTDLTQL